MTRNNFLERLSKAKRGEKILYYAGNLARDREKNKPLHDLANAAWTQAGMGWDNLLEQWRQIGVPTCALVQRRVRGSMFYRSFEYIAVKL